MTMVLPNSPPNYNSFSFQHPWTVCLLLFELCVCCISWGKSFFSTHNIPLCLHECSCLGLTTLHAPLLCVRATHSPFWKLFVSCPDPWFKVHSFRRTWLDSPSRVQPMPLGLSRERRCGPAEGLWLLSIWVTPAPVVFLSSCLNFSFPDFCWIDQQNVFWLVCVFFSKGLRVLFLSSGLARGYPHALTNTEPLFHVSSKN